MIYTKLTQKAMRTAYEAHHGQMDDGGVPYVFHPFHLAEQMDDEISVCVALLHDVVEDTSVTIEDLRNEFPVEVTETVALLTHDKNDDYFEYVSQIKRNPTAKKVKLADLTHNSDESRLISSTTDEKRILRWREKYRKAMDILLTD